MDAQTRVVVEARRVMLQRPRHKMALHCSQNTGDVHPLYGATLQTSSTPGVSFRLWEACGNPPIAVQTGSATARTSADSAAVTAGMLPSTRPSSLSAMFPILTGTERANSHPLPGRSSAIHICNHSKWQQQHTATLQQTRRKPDSCYIGGHSCGHSRD